MQTVVFILVIEKNFLIIILQTVTKSYTTETKLYFQFSLKKSYNVMEYKTEAELVIASKTKYCFN